MTSSKTNKLKNFIGNISLKLKYAFIKVRKFFIESHIKHARSHWIISKNRNFYNPTLEATIFKYGNGWKIARYGDYFGEFKLKEEAVEEVFQIWLKEKKMIEIVNELEGELQNIKQIILK